MKIPTERMLQFFSDSHLPEPLQTVVRRCKFLADDMVEMLPSSVELTVGLRKLLEAKDCFVRALLEKGE
jgi:hypothetical protein